ncbi:MAG: alpha/beta fold hydrolase [Hyphomicrobiales bacterium]
MKIPDGKLVSTEDNEIPEGAESGVFESSDDRLLRYAIWPALGDARKGTVCLFQGRGEFIEKYYETVNDLRARGYAVAALDWRGQGGSGYTKRKFLDSYVGTFEEYEDDLITFMRFIVLPDCPPPYHAIAHSTGGLVMASVLQRRTWFEKVIITAPLLQLASRTIPWRGVQFFAGFLTAVGFGGLSLPGRKARSFVSTPFYDNPFTSDEERFNRIKEVAQTHSFLSAKRPRIGWLHAAFRAMSHARAVPAKSELCSPVMIISSRRDQVVNRDAAEEFANRIGNATNIVIDGARHELLMERDELREQFWAAFDSFFEDIQPGTAKPQMREKAA